jgi:hypothetical protein
MSDLVIHYAEDGEPPPWLHGFVRSVMRRYTGKEFGGVLRTLAVSCAIDDVISLGCFAERLGCPRHIVLAAFQRLGDDGVYAVGDVWDTDLVLIGTSSSFVGCTTGKSAGFSPLRMRPV